MLSSWAQNHHTAYTINHEYFDIKKFSDSMAHAKIKHTKYMRNINDNAVQGRLSKIYLTRKIIAWNILDTKYSRFMIAENLAVWQISQPAANLKFANIKSFLIILRRRSCIVKQIGGCDICTNSGTQYYSLKSLLPHTDPLRFVFNFSFNAG